MRPHVSPGTVRHLSRGVARLAGSLTAVFALAVVLGGALGPADAWRTASHPRGEDASQATVTASKAPHSPPAPVCGSRSLRGPSTPPQGARVVGTGQDLVHIANTSRRGKVFWLAPGVHRLGRGQYSQVVPRDGQVFIGAPGAVIDGQHLNLYAFGGSANGVTVSHLTIRNFGSAGDNNNQGVVNHDAAPHWRVRHNTVRNVAGAAVFIGSHNRVVGNCLTRNGQYGFSVYRNQGVRDVVLRHNEISYNNTDNWEKRRPGCGCTGGGKFWDTRRARVVDNWVHDNFGPGLWADTDNTGFLIEGNLISDNDMEGLFYEISYNARIVHNTFSRNAWVKGQEKDDFTGAIYLSESGSDKRAGRDFGRHLLIAHNRFVNNWSGVMAWENPDRFAGSPANSSSDYTTLVNPKVATVRSCGTPSKIGTKPYFSDCRWKVQHLRVKHNRFVFNPAKIPGCTRDAVCGYQGLFSNYGTYPSWSPYKKYVVPNHITFRQDNRWSDNTYIGPWRFMAHTLGHTISWKKWRSDRFDQDARSMRH
jgi:hypothetical protein